MVKEKSRTSIFMPSIDFIVLIFTSIFLITLCPHLVTADVKSFESSAIVIGVQDAPAIGGPAAEHAKSWEKKTGGKAVVKKYPFGELYQEFKNGISTNPSQFDVILYASSWVGDFHNFLSPLPIKLTESETFDDVHTTYRDRLMLWEGKWIAVTVDGDLFNGYYRKDLFADNINRSNFKKRYGYELSPPETWSQYRDIAEFFTGFNPDKKKQTLDKPLYGTSEPFAHGGQSYWDLFSRVSAYVNHPEQKGSQFFDPETMKAQVNNEGWIRAVTEYIEILKFCPPDAVNYNIVDSRMAFIEGKSAMTLDWGDTAQISADPKISKIVDKVGYFVLPGTKEIWNNKTQKWEKQKNVFQAPFLAFGGWVASVPVNSANKDAAWDYIMWFSNPENSLHDVVKSGTGINPYRYSHFFALDEWSKAFSPRAASEFLSVLKASLDSPYAALDLRILGYDEYINVLEAELTAIINGKQKIKQGMDKVALEWEKITDRLGRENQKKIYRASMGLSN
ncbi:MAG: extracellular solute-binding protein [Desulfamplus sp.]|nr:extracellular solute-binding protein [Desulfamplus sp.]